ncbi:MAG: acetylxylan esterase [Lentisphaeria bacterium]|nr:acetylxylan esterase [Lentisphaeria bacterium]
MKAMTLAFALCAAAVLSAASIVPEGGRHYRKVGDKVVFNIQLDPGRNRTEFRATVYGNKDILGVRNLVSDDSGKAQLELPALRPGFLYVKIQDEKITAAAGVAVEPEKITPSRPAPDDFDAYWDAVKTKIDRMPMTFDREEIPVKMKNFHAYKIRIDLGDRENLDAYGILTVPAGAAPKSLPARLVVHGAGTDTVSPIFRPGCMVFSLNPMPTENKGKNGEQIKTGRFRNYRWENMLDRDKIFFNGMFQRVYRSLRFLKSLPEWNRKTLIVSGTSQGGGQAIAGAGLDPDVTLCVAHVPALCGHAGRNDGVESGWPFFYQRKIFQENPDRALAATAYVDAVNFARRIKNAEVLFSTGFIDRACPSATVYAAFNVIPSLKKRIINSVNAMHTVPKEVREEAENVIAEHIAKLSKP